MKPQLRIEYCPGCRWLTRATWIAQELLLSFQTEGLEVTLSPSKDTGVFRVSLNSDIIFDRQLSKRFPEPKELKRLIRDNCYPEKDLGHSDRD